MDIEATSVRIRVAIAIDRIDRYVTNYRDTQPTLLMLTYE